MKTQRLASLGSAYVATFATLLRTEVADDMQATQAALTRKAIAGALLLLGGIWLNVALLVFFMQIGYPLIGPLVIGVLAALIGIVLMMGRKARTPSEFLGGTREVVRSELAAMGFSPEPDRRVGAELADPNQPAPVPERLTPEGAHARMRDLRIQMGQILSPATSAHYVKGGEPPPVVGFQPKSKTMRWMCHVYNTGSSSRMSKAVAGGVASLVAARYPKLRRSIALFSLVRGVGRAAGERMRRA